jgi:VIT1/CCC1 family predicted Fe2+/Mn2+ transporter
MSTDAVALRVTVGGALAMAITFGIGHLVGQSVT